MPASLVAFSTAFRRALASVGNSSVGNVSLPWRTATSSGAGGAQTASAAEWIPPYSRVPIGT
eukprot:4175363-Lingulodinium_polyedra.AAC.1